MASPTDPGAPAHQVTGLVTDRAGHSARPRSGTPRRAAAVAGVLAVAAAVGFGTAALIRSPGQSTSTPASARHITVTTPVIPLTAQQITALLTQPPDFGASGGGLGDPARRASCLAGLGYPAATRILGARPVQVEGRSGTVLVLAGETPGTLTAIAVATTCSAADTGLLATTTVSRP